MDWTKPEVSIHNQRLDQISVSANQLLLSYEFFISMVTLARVDLETEKFEGWESVVGWQAEQFGSEVFHAPQDQRGLLGEGTVQVVIWNHHHLHPSSQPRLHPVRRIFKHQALSRQGNMQIRPHLKTMLNTSK